MSTRGAWGYVIDGVTKTAYNHSDSYPSGLGEDILRHAKWCAANPELALEMVRKLEMVSDKAEPTADQIERLMPYADLHVSRQDPRDWYCLLRKCQGDPEATLAAGVMLDANGYLGEYAYVIDLDEWQFQLYDGNRPGRPFAWPLGDLPVCLEGIE